MSGKIATAAFTAALLCSFDGRSASAAISQTLSVEGNIIVVSSGPVQGEVTFNGRRIIDSDNGAMAHGTYSAPGKTFVLFETDQGPSCAMFRVIAVAGRQASVSPVFGNCGGADAAVVNGALRVHLAVVPAHGTFPASPAETHSFDGKTLPVARSSRSAAIAASRPYGFARTRAREAARIQIGADAP